MEWGCRIFSLLFLLGISLHLVLGTGNTNTIGGKIVETKSGKVRSTVSVSRDGREVWDWLGIPYGKIPERFATAVPVTPWTRVFDAATYGPICPQLSMVTHRLRGDEDCLSLNIHVPKNLPEGKRVPVLVFIHGGYYTTGSSKDFRPDFFMDQDVALVTINYRLGPLGFLNVGDKNSRGNMGLKDQNLALRWIKENIASFGPIDPQNIVVFGQSAGAASTHFHLFSPMSKGLLSKVIAQSGVVVSSWTINDDPLGQAEYLASSMDCPSNRSSTREMVDCLRKVPLAKILRPSNKNSLEPISRKGLVFVPTIETVNDEETFISTHPEKLLEAGEFERIPMMTGTTSEEGGLFTQNYFKNESYRIYMDENWKKFAETVLLLTPQELRNAQAIRDFYFGQGTRLNPFNSSVFSAFTTMMTDKAFLKGATNVAEIQSKYSPVYLYYYEKAAPFFLPLITAFQRRSVLTFATYKFRTWLSQFGAYSFDEKQGPVHGDDLPMLFHMPYLFNIRPMDPHYAFSKDLVKLWVDFAYNETSMRFRNQPNFPPVSPNEKLKHLIINDFASYEEPHADIKRRLEFWKYIENENNI